jgi:hypothetical protein
MYYVYLTARLLARRPGEARVRELDRVLRLGAGRIAASDIEAPNMLAIPV